MEKIKDCSDLSEVDQKRIGIMKKTDFVLEKLFKLLEEYKFTIRVGNGDIIFTIGFGAKKIARAELQKCLKDGIPMEANNENNGVNVRALEL